MSSPHHRRAQTFGLLHIWFEAVPVRCMLEVYVYVTVFNLAIPQKGGANTYKIRRAHRYYHQSA